MTFKKILSCDWNYKENYIFKLELPICNTTQCIFHEDTETCTPVYTEYFRDYKVFYKACETDINKAKETKE